MIFRDFTEKPALVRKQAAYAKNFFLVRAWEEAGFSPVFDDDASATENLTWVCDRYVITGRAARTTADSLHLKTEQQSVVSVIGSVGFCFLF